MKLGGWQRIWIVIVIIYTIFVAVVAYNGKPTLKDVHTSWFSDAAHIVSREISDKEERYISAYDVHQGLFVKGTAHSIAWLERVERSPTPIQQVFSKEIGELNVKYRASLANFPKTQWIYWLQVIGWWVGGCLLLYLIGWTCGWVIRGFRSTSRND